MVKRSGEATKRRGVEAGATKKLGSSVSIEAHRQLEIHSLMSGEDHGTILNRLILEGLKEWHVRANPTRSEGRKARPADEIEDRPEVADQVMASAAA